MKVQELFEAAFPTFSAQDKATIIAEIEKKFKNVFRIKGEKMEVPADFDPYEGEGEKLRMDFWYGIVEPGWEPKLIAATRKKIRGDDMEDMEDKLNDLLDDLQHQAAENLGIPVDLIEL